MAPKGSRIPETLALHKSNPTNGHNWKLLPLCLCLWARAGAALPEYEDDAQLGRGAAEVAKAVRAGTGTMGDAVAAGGGGIGQLH